MKSIASYFTLSSSPSPIKSPFVARGLSEKVINIENRLSRKLAEETFCSGGVTTVYNPLEYASEPHQDYLSKYAYDSKKVIFVGMNPGPHGMCQNGVPFGEIKTVKEWLRVEGKVHPPKRQHPKRPIEGMNVKKREISGLRLWGLFQQMAGTPQVFFKHCLVYNYCPLCFIDAGGKNVAPNNLSPAEREKLTLLCDQAIRDIVEVLQPNTLVGVGKWTEDRLVRIQKKFNLPIRVVGIMHPSPLNARANTNYAGQVKAELDRLAISKYVIGQSNPEDSVDTSFENSSNGSDPDVSSSPQSV